MPKNVEIQKILKATGKTTLEEAAEVVEKGLAIAAKNDYVLSHIGTVTLVFGPTGLITFTVSPETSMSLGHLQMLEQALLEFQSALIQRRTELMQEKVNSATKAQPTPQGEA